MSGVYAGVYGRRTFTSGKAIKGEKRTKSEKIVPWTHKKLSKKMMAHYARSIKRNPELGDEINKYVIVEQADETPRTLRGVYHQFNVSRGKKLRVGRPLVKRDETTGQILRDAKGKAIPISDTFNKMVAFREGWKARKAHINYDALTKPQKKLEYAKFRADWKGSNPRKKQVRKSKKVIKPIATTEIIKAITTRGEELPPVIVEVQAKKTKKSHYASNLAKYRKIHKQEKLTKEESKRRFDEIWARLNKNYDGSGMIAGYSSYY